MEKIEKVLVPGEFSQLQRSDASAYTGLDADGNPEISRTDQSFTRESDINYIVDLYGIGQNPITVGQWTTNVDIVDAAQDFQSAMAILVQAREDFMQIPAATRALFDNDPALFVDFCSNPDNADKMEEMGLLSEQARSSRAEARQKAADEAFHARVKAEAAAAAAKAQSSS